MGFLDSWADRYDGASVVSRKSHKSHRSSSHKHHKRDKSHSRSDSREHRGKRHHSSSEAGGIFGEDGNYAKHNASRGSFFSMGNGSTRSFFGMGEFALFLPSCIPSVYRRGTVSAGQDSRST